MSSKEVIPRIDERKVNALIAIVQRAPMSAAEAIFAEEFMTFMRNIARLQTEIEQESKEAPKKAAPTEESKA